MTPLVAGSRQSIALAVSTELLPRSRSVAQGARLAYGEAASPFGRVWLMIGSKGLVACHFVGRTKLAIETLAGHWSDAAWHRNDRTAQAWCDRIFTETSQVDGEPLPVHLRGTAFQLEVWRALLELARGETTTYSRLAEKIGRPGAARAVGNAVGANPVAYLIPCHRVLRESGALGGYRWGAACKQRLLEWEMAGQSFVIGSDCFPPSEPTLTMTDRVAKIG